MPAAGILDVLDNYAFVRTSGYLAGADDVYLSLSMVRKYVLRRGDAIVGQVRQPREGERKEKFNPMVRIDSVNGADPESAKSRVEFSHLTPVHPHQRLRLETTPDNLIGRVIDIVTPVGKGQRGLIVAPAQAGKTQLLQSVATSITTNNPECHLMVVLVDERPEEVTDLERAVKGEVIASTFDQAPADHTTVAELAVERAKRLVELGHDVVVLIDGLSRLGRAYNVAGPTSGRTLAGGVDASALTATKRLFGAARSLEDAGSLTILATTLVDTGSTVDELLVEELIGTESLVLRLDGDLADERVFPAVDLAPVRHPPRGRAGRRPGARRPREAAPRADRRAWSGAARAAGQAAQDPDQLRAAERCPALVVARPSGGLNCPEFFRFLPHGARRCLILESQTRGEGLVKWRSLWWPTTTWTSAISSSSSSRRSGTRSSPWPTAAPLSTPAAPRTRTWPSST